MYGGTLITRQDLERSGETDLFQAISRRVPGVAYTNGKLFIRGTHSILLDSEPLYVVDGVQLSGIPPSIPVFEVESVEVVKNAASSYFGLRAANGAIVINTRKK